MSTVPTCPGCGKPAHASESDDDNFHAGCRPLTADTITDAHISRLIDFAHYMEWSETLRIALSAHHGIVIKQTRRSIKRTKEGPAYRAVLTKCAEIYNRHKARIEREEMPA